MTVVDLIEQIRSLAPQERAKVLGALLEIEAAQGMASMEDQAIDRGVDRAGEPNTELPRKPAQ